MGKKLLKVHQVKFDGDMSYKWYTVLVNFNHEKNALKNILNTANAKGRGNEISETLIPIREWEETVHRQLKSGKISTRVVTKKENILEGGYIFIKCVMSNEMWNIIRQSSGVAGYLNSDGQPHPVPEEEIERIKILLNPEEESSETTDTVNFNGQIGDLVKIPQFNVEAKISFIDHIKKVLKAESANGVPFEVNISDVELVNV